MVTSYDFPAFRIYLAFECNNFGAKESWFVMTDIHIYAINSYISLNFTILANKVLFLYLLFCLIYSPSDSIVWVASLTLCTETDQNASASCTSTLFKPFYRPGLGLPSIGHSYHTKNQLLLKPFTKEK